MTPRNVLILGGTAEASALARALVARRDIAPVLSLAGRTQSPVLPPIPYRVGGFGGTEGLTDYLMAHRIDVLIDATHPFAAQISRHAALAASAAGIKLLAIRRPPWRAGPGDNWTETPDIASAAAAIGRPPRRVFLAIGRQELAPFRAFAHHYVIRSVEPPGPSERPNDATIIAARGPFDLDSEQDLLREHRIEILVTKNSGGVTGEKLIAARALGLPVIMVARPAKPAVPEVVDHLGALAWLHDTERGV